MKQFVWKFALIGLVFTMAAACGNKTESTGETNKQGTVQSNDNQAQTETDDTSVVTVDEKQTEKLLAQFNNTTPAKAVTISVAITEILGELGVEPAGVPTTNSELPAAFAGVPRIGSSHQPDLEQIAKLQPDVIIGPSSIKDSLDKKFKPASLPTAYLPVDSLDELKLSTVVLGRLFKQEAKANAFLEKFAQEENAVLEAAKGKDAPKVLFLFGSAESLMFMNEDTFVGSLAKKLGASNVVSDVLKQTETYIPLNMESIVEANPDIILLVAHGDPAAAAKKFEEDVKKNGAWEKLNAFKNGKMKTLDYSQFGIASIVKAPAAYKQLAEALYDK